MLWRVLTERKGTQHTPLRETQLFSSVKRVKLRRERKREKERREGEDRGEGEDNKVGIERWQIKGGQRGKE